MPESEIDFSAAMNPPPPAGIIEAETVEPDETLPAVITLDPQAAIIRLAQHDQELALMVSRAQALTVVDDASNQLAAECALQAKKLYKEIEAYRKEIVGPHNEFISTINNAAKRYLEPLLLVEKGMGRKQGDYRQIQENERRKAEALAQQAAREAQAKLEAEAKAAEKKGVVYQPVQVVAPVMPEVPKVTRTSGGASSQAKRWDFEVENEDLVPRDCLSVDEKKIRARVKGGERNIPGVRIFETYDTKYRI